MNNDFKTKVLQSILSSKNTIYITARAVGKTTSIINGVIGKCNLQPGSNILVFASNHLLAKELFRGILNAFDRNTIAIWSNAGLSIHLKTGGIVIVKSIKERLIYPTDRAKINIYSKVVFDDPATCDEDLEYWVRVLNISTTIVGTHFGKYKPDTQKEKTFFYQLYEWGQEPLISNWESAKFSYQDVFGIEQYEYRLKELIGVNGFNTNIKADFSDN